VGVSQYPDASVRRVRNLEAGATIEEIIEQFDIAREQINAVLNLPPAVLILSQFTLHLRVPVTVA